MMAYMLLSTCENDYSTTHTVPPLTIRPTATIAWRLSSFVTQTPPTPYSSSSNDGFGKGILENDRLVDWLTVVVFYKMSALIFRHTSVFSLAGSIIHEYGSIICQQFSISTNCPVLILSTSFGGKGSVAGDKLNGAHTPD